MSAYCGMIDINSTQYQDFQAMNTSDNRNGAAELRVSKRQAARIRAGHPWIYSNEVDTRATPLKDFAPGETVSILDSGGGFIGGGYVNPNALICARLVSRKVDERLGRDLLVARLKTALDLRRRLFSADYYRLVYGEADGLPGLVIDRYGETLIVQIGTVGMERVKDAIVQSLQEVLRPACIFFRNDTAARTLEGLDAYTQAAVGELPERLRVEENGAVFEVSSMSGQKTGWFFDQRLNRAAIAKYCRGAAVLDLFSYAGGFGIQAALAGAREVLCVDSSQAAVDAVLANARLNGSQDRVASEKANVFDLLTAFKAEGRRFDVVVVDPPAFIKRKKDVATGIAGYRRLNKLAQQVLVADGIVLTASCSQHLRREVLLAQVIRASEGGDRRLQLLEQGHQGPDHPINPAMPESDYLKSFIFRVQRT